MQISSLNSVGIHTIHICVLTGGGEPLPSNADKSGPNAAMPPKKRPKMAQNRHIPRYNKKTKQHLWINFGVYYLLGRKQAKSDYFSEIVPHL